MTDTHTLSPRQPTPHDKLMIVISMLQNHFMAEDSLLNGRKIFGHHYMPSASIEHAIALLADLLPYLENVEESQQ